MSPSAVIHPTRHEPIIVTAPAHPKAAVVLIHGPGETRTGTNFLLIEIERRLLAAGMAVARFDLTGHGESLHQADVGTWLEQIDDAQVLLRLQAGAAPLHLIARGAHAALLPGSWESGLRIAIVPPPAAAVRALAAEAGGDEVVGRLEGPSPHPLLWSRIGVVPSLRGGLTLSLPLLGELAERLDAGRRWDHECSPRHPLWPSGLSETDSLVVKARTRALVANVLAGDLEAYRPSS